MFKREHRAIYLKETTTKQQFFIMLINAARCRLHANT